MSIASPHKKQRASMDGLDAVLLPPLDSTQSTTSAANGQLQSTTNHSSDLAPLISAVPAASIPPMQTVQDEDEEL